MVGFIKSLVLVGAVHPFPEGIRAARKTSCASDFAGEKVF